MLKIITDSASDLSEELISRYQLHVIPTPVVIDEVDYLDGKTIQTGEFYKILDDTSRDVRTYHINPAMFEEAFMPYAKMVTALFICAFPQESQVPSTLPILQGTVSWKNILILI